MYSDSVVDRATELCFFDDQDTAPPRDGPSSRACSMFDSIDSTRFESSREFLLENSSRAEEFCSRRRVEQGSLFDRDRIESSPIKALLDRCSTRNARLEMFARIFQGWRQYESRTATQPGVYLAGISVLTSEQVACSTRETLKCPAHVFVHCP